MTDAQRTRQASELDLDPGVAAALERLAAGETLAFEEVSSAPLFARDRFNHVIGLRWGSFHRDRVTASLEVEEPHHQPYGIVHGGVWCTVVESVASVAAALRVGAEGRIVVGVSNTTDFLRAHRSGPVAAVATPVHVGRLQHLWQVEIARTSDERLVARGQVRLQVLDPSQLGGRR